MLPTLLTDSRERSLLAVWQRKNRISADNSPKENRHSIIGADVGET